MPESSSAPVLYLIACGARPVADLPAFITTLQGHGWDVCVVLTPSAIKFADIAALAELTRRPVRSDYKRPDEPDVFPPPDAIILAPATFNTINKWAAGISDTLALGLLNEALGRHLPIIAVPTPNTALAQHRAFRNSVEFLRTDSVDILFDPDTYPLPNPQQGPSAAELFPWTALAERTERMRAALAT